MDDPGLTTVWLEQNGFVRPERGTLWWRSLGSDPQVELGVSIYGAWELRQVEDGEVQTVRPAGQVKTRGDVLDLVRTLSRLTVSA